MEKNMAFGECHIHHILGCKKRKQTVHFRGCLHSIRRLNTTGGDQSVGGEFYVLGLNQVRERTEGKGKTRAEHQVERVLHAAIKTWERG